MSCANNLVSLTSIFDTKSSRGAQPIPEQVCKGPRIQGDIYDPVCPYIALLNTRTPRSRANHQSNKHFVRVEALSSASTVHSTSDPIKLMSSCARLANVLVCGRRQPDRSLQYCTDTGIPALFAHYFGWSYKITDS
jgi:hypothetical protein